jgi:hypothetical protein
MQAVGRRRLSLSLCRPHRHAFPTKIDVMAHHELSGLSTALQRLLLLDCFSFCFPYLNITHLRNPIHTFKMQSRKEIISKIYKIVPPMLESFHKGIF